MDRRPRPRPRWRLGLILAVVVLLVVEAALMAGVFLSPGFSSRLSARVASVERQWTGTKSSPGIPTRTKRVLLSAYHTWITPLWSAPAAPKVSSAFRGCATCHPDYGSKRRFPTVYMNHPLHAQLGLQCKTCHVDTSHPNPAVPDEATCQKCHRDVRQAGKCGLCHPPASLPHFYLLGAPRDGPVQCNTCHPPKSFTGSHQARLVDLAGLNGANKQVCRSCHAPSTCQSCHGSPHPSNWVNVHGQDVSQGGQTTCANCHTGAWCADRCHTARAGGPVRRPLPSPTGGLP